jgi:trk system potassium uptake protein TrkH
MFEAVSAFNTVGLSMGITPMLSVPSRWLLIGLMFIGRTGPLAIASALVVRLARRGSYRLAYEDVIVG